MTLQYGEELVINGGFDTNTNWTQAGEVSIVGGCVMASGYGPSMGLSQEIGVIAGQFYQAAYTIQSYVDGDIFVKLGSAAGQVRSSDGTYIEIIKAVGDPLISFDFSGASFAEFELDNVSVKEVLIVPVPAAFIHAGRNIDYTPISDVADGSIIVLGDLVCVASLDIPANTLGALAVEGVFDINKATGVGTGIAVGTKVYWDVADQQATSDDESGANKYLGKTIAAAGDDDAKVRVRLGQ